MEESVQHYNGERLAKTIEAIAGEKDEGRLVTNLDGLERENEQLKYEVGWTRGKKREETLIAVQETNMKIHITRVHLATIRSKG